MDIISTLRIINRNRNDKEKLRGFRMDIVKYFVWQIINKATSQLL